MQIRLSYFILRASIDGQWYGRKLAAMTLVWGEKYATGIKEIDDQHKALFVEVNELLEAARVGMPKEEIGKLISSLHEHSVMHFECEEGHMELRKCSVCAANRLAHREFLRDLADLSEQFDREGATLHFVDDVEEKVCAWLSTHLLAIDIALRETVDQDVPAR